VYQVLGTYSFICQDALTRK